MKQEDIREEKPEGEKAFETQESADQEETVKTEEASGEQNAEGVCQRLRFISVFGCFKRQNG